MPKTLFAVLLLMLLHPATGCATPLIVVSIQPLHALTKMVTGNRIEPQLLMKQKQSPHDYRLTPAAARMLANADLVLWVGKGLESAVSAPLQNLVPPQKRLTIIGLPGIHRLPARSGGIWEHGHEHDTADADMDSHLWLDADNAVLIIRHILERLMEIDPAYAPTYRQNAESAIVRIQATDRLIRQRFREARPRAYWVLHDSLQYFEHRYNLHAAGAIMINPERKPGAKRMLELRRQLQQQDIACILYEPRYGRRWIDVLIEGSHTQAIGIDPMGLEIQAGSDYYEKLLLNLADQLAKCASIEQSSPPSEDQLPENPA